MNYKEILGIKNVTYTDKATNEIRNYRRLIILKPIKDTDGIGYETSEYKCTESALNQAKALVSKGITKVKVFFNEWGSIEYVTEDTEI